MEGSKDVETEKDKTTEIIHIDLDDSDSSESNVDRSSGNSGNEGRKESSGNNTNEHRTTRVLKETRSLTLKDHLKYMGNFDPEFSNRERRKLTRKLYAEGSSRKNGQLYDESGVLLSNEKDLCDCLTESCPGCHFPCSKCRSCKCGHDCRVNRKWMYDAIENEGEKTSLKNPYPAPT